MKSKENSIASIENSKCKGLEVGKTLVYSRNRKEVSVTGVPQAKKAEGDEGEGRHI